MSLLQLNDVHTYYGQIHAIKGISLTVEEGEIVTLIGGNGAGKTTTLNTISSVINAREGEVLLNGENITHYPPHVVVERNVIHVPEGRKIFTKLSVEENLTMGAFQRNDNPGIKRDMEYVYELFPRLLERRRQYGGTLSGGEQQMLAIGRAIMAQPRILLMDEPSMGLAPLLVQQIFDVIEYLNKEQNATILLVEQNALMALEVADRAYVLQSGRITHSGDAKELQQDESIIEAYLGG
jgi:branched-chain amino acid transport system ATP-binding protein